MSPRSAPTATGKKARNAPITDADSHRGHTQSPTCTLPPQLTTSGARAINGTVCDTTRYGSRPALDDPEPRHQHRQRQPDGDAEGEPEHGESEREPGAGEHDPPDVAVGTAPIGLGVPREHVPHVGHRGVVGAGQDRPPEHLAAVLRSELLVHLPQRRCHQQRRDEQNGAPHDFAATDWAIAGMMWSPYAWSVLSLPSCCR